MTHTGPGEAGRPQTRHWPPNRARRDGRRVGRRWWEPPSASRRRRVPGDRRTRRRARRRGPPAGASPARGTAAGGPGRCGRPPVGPVPFPVVGHGTIVARRHPPAHRRTGAPLRFRSRGPAATAPACREPPVTTRGSPAPRGASPREADRIIPGGRQRPHRARLRPVHGRPDRRRRAGHDQGRGPRRRDGRHRVRRLGDTSLTARTRILFAFRELADRHREDLAAAITAEHGKVLEDARGEVARGIEVIEFACGIPHLLKGEFSEDVSTGVDASSIRQPLGVVAGITPFNFPVMVPMWMYPVAIACGNTFILKPSERDPSPSELVADLWRDAGLPDGCSTSSTATPRPSTPCWTIRRSPPCPSSARRRSPATSSSGATRRASGSRPSGGPRTTPWCCPTPTSTRRPTP